MGRGATGAPCGVVAAGAMAQPAVSAAATAAPAVVMARKERLSSIGSRDCIAHAAAGWVAEINTAASRLSWPREALCAGPDIGAIGLVEIALVLAAGAVVEIEMPRRVAPGRHVEHDDALL